MKKSILALTLIAALVLSLAACGTAAPAAKETPAADPEVTEAAVPAESESTEPAETETAGTEPAETETAEAEPAETETAETEVTEAVETEKPEAAVSRQDGERFEAIFSFQGMDETLGYEHIINTDLGLEMDYPYDHFVRYSEAECERFVSTWDDQSDPENYMTVERRIGSAELNNDAVCAVLSNDYDITSFPFELDSGVTATRIEASVIKGTNNMADQIIAVYIIPASDGCIVATSHCFIVESEALGKHFSNMVKSMIVLDTGVVKEVSDDMALSAVKYYCYTNDPEMEAAEKDEEHPVRWDITSSDEKQILVVFTSYTGAELRYYVDRASGETYVTEFVPGVTAEEQRTEESFNVWDYIG